MHGNPSAPANRSVAQPNVGREADDRLAYSVNEAAQRLGVGPMTLYREIAEGKLPAIRIRDRILVPKVVLERLVLQPHFSESLPLSPVATTSAGLVTPPPG
jgi:excisionase family DNA binding protein